MQLKDVLWFGSLCALGCWKTTVHPVGAQPDVAECHGERAQMLDLISFNFHVSSGRENK